MDTFETWFIAFLATLAIAISLVVCTDTICDGQKKILAAIEAQQQTVEPATCEIDTTQLNFAIENAVADILDAYMVELKPETWEVR